MKNSKIAKVALASGGFILMTLSEAQAALNAGVATGFTALQADALELVDLVWPVTIAVTVAFIILGLFKRAASKAV
ncbi:MAG: hypothetical protein Q8Q50_06020 [Methylobacter sp.]|nr:hypothetical protein [Methylobacter sp.]